MTNKEFDDILKKKLSGIENKSKPDWENFFKKLEHQNSADESFDRTFEEKFKSLKKEIKTSHWESLRQRLIKEEYIRSRLYTLKSLESFSLLLLLIVLMNNQVIKFDFSQFADSSLYADLFNRNEVLPQRINNQLTYNIKKYNAQNIANEDLQLENQFKNDIFTSESPRTFLEPATINVKNVTLRKEIEKRIQNLMISQTNEILMYSDGERNTVETFDDLEGSNLIDVKPLSDKPYVDTRMVYNPHIYSKGKTYYDVSLYANNGLLQVKSPYDPLYMTDANTRYGTMSRIGVLVGAGSERFKIKTGLEYSFQLYKPLKVEEIFGSFTGGMNKYSLQSVRLDAVALPVRLSYTLLTAEKSKLNIIAGVNTNILANAYYNITTDELSREESLIYNNANRVSQRSSKQEPILFQKNYPKGFLKDGKFNNIFFDANLEVEFERKVTENKSIQVAIGSLLSVNNNGIGPNNDALNSAYVRIGLNYKLN
jgi:hypothetical protein